VLDSFLPNTTRTRSKVFCFVEIFRTDNSQKFNLCKSEEKNWSNASEKKIALLIQQEFSDARGYYWIALILENFEKIQNFT